MKAIFLILIGFSEGSVVGISLIAFLVILNIIPRLIQFSNSKEYIRFYRILIIGGAVSGTIIQFFQITLPSLYYFNFVIVVLIGFIFGIFIGLLAGALTEVLKVLPILSNRLGLRDEIEELLLIIILGKSIGSLIYWLIPGLWT